MEDTLKNNNTLSKDVLTDETKGLIIPLLDYFSNVNNLVIAIYNSNGKEFWSTQTQYLSPMCSLIKKYPVLWDLCKKDHAKRARANSFDSKHQPKLSLCHLGLWNIAYPIYHDDVYYGVLMAGQKKFSDEEKQNQTIEVFNTRLNKLFSEELISNEVKKLLIEKFSEINIIDNFPRKALETLATIEESFIDIIKNLLKRINRVTLLRHELHQPNTAARGILCESYDKLSELLQNKNFDQSGIEILQEILQNINYSIGNSKLFSVIIENICSSLSDDLNVLIPKRCNILYILNCASKIFQSPAGEKGVIFSSIEKINFDTCHIYGDESLLMRIFINLYHNAVKYSYFGQNDDNPRRIDTLCENLKDFFKVTILNYGLGILPEEIDKVWLDGYRGKLSSDRRRTGSGLGLYQVDQIVKLHNGERNIESLPVGNLTSGPYLTKVTILLPYDYKTNIRS
jgi:signal transduction histidine kinase